MSLDTSSLPPPPQISLRTLQMAGLLVDVYGLAELPSLSSETTQISCLWLHHQRGRNKEYMADIAARCVGAWNSHSHSQIESQSGGGGGGKRRGLIALAYDQRNHGSRLVDERANGSWREGNAMHAVDMFGVVEGMVADQGVLLYVFPGKGGGWLGWVCVLT